MSEARERGGNRLAIADPADVARATDLMDHRFGIPSSAFEGYIFLRTSQKLLSIVVADHIVPPRPPAASVGMPFLRTHLHFPKPTTAAILHFGGLARRNVVSLSASQAQAYVHRMEIEIDKRQADEWTTKGYVIVRHADLVLGLGFFRDDPAPVVLRSLYPRAWSPGGD